MPERCPCGSQIDYTACCGLLHRGAPAPSALALMRSRFTAFAVGEGGYLLDSWHPETRPPVLPLDPTVRWRRLQIVDTVAGGLHDTDGEVEFRASYQRDGAHAVLHERSRFSRVGGRWMYVDGHDPDE